MKLSAFSGLLNLNVRGLLWPINTATYEIPMQQWFPLKLVMFEKYFVVGFFQFY